MEKKIALLKEKLAEISKNLSLLYVEDSNGLRHQAEKIFKRFFSNVVSASDGEEGYKLFRENPYDIVITDIKMPKIDGLELIKLIRDINEDVKLPMYQDVR